MQGYIFDMFLHKTETRQPAGTRDNTEHNAEAAAGEGEREPEKPTETTPEKTPTAAETDMSKNPNQQHYYSTTDMKTKPKSQT